jgi:hypothetical protein
MTGMELLYPTLSQKARKDGAPEIPHLKIEMSGTLDKTACEVIRRGLKRVPAFDHPNLSIVATFAHSYLPSVPDVRVDWLAYALHSLQFEPWGRLWTF